MLSDRLSAAGRDAKSIQDARDAHAQTLRQFETERSNWQKTRDDADMESVKGDSSKLDAVKLRIQAREREAEANRKLSEVENIRRENETLKVERETWQRQSRVESIAKETGVDPKVLAEYAELPEGKLRTLAKTLPKVTNQTNETLQIDSGGTKGMIGELTPERADKMSMEEYANHPSVKKRFGTK
jgi:FtsZ-binding cell division protein ZapB